MRRAGFDSAGPHPAPHLGHRAGALPKPTPRKTDRPPQENDFSGPIPTAPDWRNIHTLRIGNNSFDTIPDEFYLMSGMVLLDAMNNT